MPQSPKLSEYKTSQIPSLKNQSLSAPMLLLVTALDTTWRVFVPTLGGTFAGVELDKLLNTAPIGVISCLILGIILSIVLISRQLIHVRKPLR